MKTVFVDLADTSGINNTVTGRTIPLTQGELREPTRLEKLEAEIELFGYAIFGHPLELFPDVAWETYCPVNQLHQHVGETIVTCGLVVEQRTHHQITGEPMKFLTLADWTGMVETELFAQTYKSYGLATVRYPKHLISLLVFRLAIVILSITVCALHADEPASKTASELCFSGLATNYFKMTVCFSNSLQIIGKPMPISVLLENITTNQHPIRITDGLMDFNIQLTGPDGKEVQCTDFGGRYLHPSELYHRSIENIEPRRQMNFSFDMNELFIFKLSGNYSLKMSRTIYGRDQLHVGPIIFIVTNTTVRKGKQ